MHADPPSGSSAPASQILVLPNLAPPPPRLLDPRRRQAPQSPHGNPRPRASSPLHPARSQPDNKSEEATSLHIRALYVDGNQKEWTVGEVHDVTDRTFVIRRALHINDSLPGEAPRWTWQARLLAHGRPHHRPHHRAPPRRLRSRYLRSRLVPQLCRLLRHRPPPPKADSSPSSPSSAPAKPSSRKSSRPGRKPRPPGPSALAPNGSEPHARHHPTHQRPTHHLRRPRLRLAHRRKRQHRRINSTAALPHKPPFLGGNSQGAVSKNSTEHALALKVVS